MKSFVRCIMLAGSLGVADAFSATFTVTSTNHTGAGSLRQAILDANATAGTNLINFTIVVGGLTITPTNALPNVTNSVMIDGTTQPGFSGSPIIELNGQSAGAGADGLRLLTSNSVIRGLVINRFLGDGIEVTNARNIVIEGNIIGLNVTGTTDFGNTLNGILITNSSSNVIGGTNAAQSNFISGNNQNGLLVQGTNATGNVILGNYLGLSANGSNTVANGANGLFINGARSNLVGGLDAGARNLISGNSQSGVRIEGTNAFSNVIVGNTIGLGVDDTDQGNNGDGVHVLNAPGNRIGGALLAERNVISGNNGDGIEVNGLSSSNNLVLGNYVGPDPNGTLDRRNGVNGVFVNNAPGTIIGGAAVGEANLISRNQSDGVEISGLTASNNVVLGNWIGLDISGATNLGNSGHGIFLTSNARFNFIGATNSGAGNRIAFNSGDGIYVQAGTNNAIRGNNIWSNSALGIDLDNDGVTANDLGDADVGNANSRQNFPVITNAVLNTGSTLIQGTNNSVPNSTFLLDFFASAGPDPTSNGEGQVYLGSTTVTTGPDSNAVFSVNLPVTVTIGRWITATATDTNGNTSEFSAAYRASALLPGVTLTVINTNDTGPGSFRQALLDANALPTGSPHLIQFAIPGSGLRTTTMTNPSPALLEPVIIDGFTQSGSSSNTLANGNNANQLVRLQGSPASGTGLTLEGPSNVVRGIIFTGFLPQGVEVVSSDNVIEGCLFGITPAGATNGNDWGLVVRGSRNRIGGPLPGQRVVVSGNSGAMQLNFLSVSNVVQGCFVGTDIGGVGMRANAFDGISVGGTNHVIGGASPGARNVVCGFGNSGISAGGFGHTVQGNLVGTDVTGTNVLGNFTTGIDLPFGAANNLIGGAAIGAGNLILGVSGPGPCINVTGDGNVIQGNFIGTDAAGTLEAGKNWGVLVGFNSGNTIGGTNAGEGNVIAFNGEGVHISGTGNAIRGNSIHSNTGRGIALGNFFNVNDPGDVDSGANDQQNHPTITNASGTLAGTTIQGFLSSKASTLYQLDFYSSVVRDAVNRGEGQKYLGSGSVLTDGSGIGNFSVMLPTVMFGRQISATATDPAGNTSEFSDCFAATSTFPPSTNVVANTNNSGPGSFRQALLNAGTNASATPNVIAFAIPGAGPHIIRPLSALPPPLEWVAIEGFSQPVASANTSTNGDNAVRKIILDGSMAGALVNGLTFEADSNVVRGLVIQSFNGNGIAFSSNSIGNVVEGSFITGNTNSGVLINSANNRIGGTTSAARNILSGNREWGVTLSGASARENLVAGNYLGPAASGATALPNTLGGVLISSAPTNTIGGSAAGRNIIGGNGNPNFLNAAPGIQIAGAGSSNNLVQGNFIGATFSGGSLSNKGAGILISSSAMRTLIGAPQPPAAVAELENLIAFNGGHGVDVQSGDGHIIRANRIFENGGRAIFLNFGANPQQVAPVITNATITASNVAIRGRLTSKANATYGLDFYSTVIADPSGFGEAHKYLGSTNVTTDGSGNVAFNVAFAVMPTGEFITATATDETSPFATTIRATVDGSVVPQTFVVTSGAPSGPGSLAEAVNLANAHPGSDTILFAVAAVELGAGLKIVSPVVLNGDVSGQKVLVDASGVPAFQAVFELTAHGNTFSNLAVFGAAGDAFLVKSSTNLFTALEVGRQQPAQGIAGDAFEFGSSTTENVVRSTEIENVRGTALLIAFGANAELGADVSFQSVLGNLVSNSGGPAAPTVVSQTPDTNFTTVTFQVAGTNGQIGTLRVYLLDPDGHGLVTPLAATNYTIASGGSLLIPITIPFQATPKSVAAFDVRPASPDNTSNKGADEQTFFLLPSQIISLTTAINGQVASTDEPVNLLTGEYFDLLAPDLDLGGPLPLLFQRYYASFLLRDGKAIGKLGNNWRHNFEWSLTNKNTTIEIVSPMGRVITFTNDSFNFTLLGRQDIPYQLIYFFGSGDFMLADPLSQMTYRFDSSGKLIFTSDGRGNSHHLAYSGTELANVTDGLGRALSFSYSASGFLTNVSDGARSVGFAQSNSNLVQSLDALGKVSTNRYAVFPPIPGLLTHRNRPLGNTRFTQTYDSAGRVSQQYQSQANDQTFFTYGFNMAIERDPFNFEREYYHNSNGEFTGFADEANVASTMTYNANGQRASVTDRRGLTTRIAYHAPSGQVAAITNADGSVIQFTYTNRSFGGITFHDLSKVTFPDGTSESYTYDGNGNVTSLTDQAGKVSRFTWNARGQLLTATNPTGGVVTFSYNFDGTTATAADSETGATSFFYDSLKRLTNLVHPDGTSRRWQFDANDRLLSMTDERTNTVTFTYDANDRLVRIVDANGDSAGFAYDNADRIVTVTNSTGATATIAYDDRGHVSAATDFNGNPTAFGVDSRHRLTSLARNLQSWAFGYNNEAQLTSITNLLAQASSFGRDALGFLTGATNPLGHSTSFALDVMRRLTNSVDPLLRTNRFSYDARGLLASATAPVVGTASFERNDLSLLSKITGLNGEQWRFGYSALGRLQFVADPLNRTNRVSYDNRGRRVTATFADGTTLSNTLDGAGLVLRRQFSAGPDITYAYDKVNRLTNATGSDPVLFAYDANGRLTNTVSSGVNFGAAYDSAGRLTSVSYSNGAFTVTYTYNGNDQLIGVTDSLTGTLINYFYDNAGRLTVTTRPNGVNGTYTYDAAGRLTRIREGSIIDIPFTLDAAGQIVQAGFTAPLDPEALITNSQSTPLTYDAAHQINSAGYGYDARGRLTASPGKTFTWDGASRLIGIGAVALGYDGLNQIVTRAEGGVTTRYFYNHAIALAPIMAERNETTMQVQRYYVWSPGGRLLYLIDAANGNAVRHVHTDQVGSVLALTSAAGAVTDAYAYTPYGELLGRTGTSAQPFTYVGAFGVRSEPAANLYHMRARYYDPLSARFLSREPIWPVLDQPRGLDPYQYAYGEPMRFVDRTGLGPEPASGLVRLENGGSILSPIGAVPIRYGGSTLSPIGAVPIIGGTGSGDRVGYIHDYSRIIQQDRADVVSGVGSTLSPVGVPIWDSPHPLGAKLDPGDRGESILSPVGVPIWDSPQFAGFQASAGWTGTVNLSAHDWSFLHVGSVFGRNECPKEAEAGAKRLDDAASDLYLNYRAYGDFGTASPPNVEDMSVPLGGARIKF